jgi:hypothetical protein
VAFVSSTAIRSGLRECRRPGIMSDARRIIPHEAVPLCGSFEVRFPDGRPSRFFYWDDIAGRRPRPDLVDSATAKHAAQSLERSEQQGLDRRGANY